MKILMLLVITLSLGACKPSSPATDVIYFDMPKADCYQMFGTHTFSCVPKQLKGKCDEN